MLKNTFNIIFLLCLCSCQYQFGSSTQVLSGIYHVDKIKNNTSYRLVDSQLRTELVKIIQRNKESKIGTVQNADTTINAVIRNIKKIDKEIDPSTGYVTEAQFVIEAEFLVKGKSNNKKYNILNINHKNSSGIYRPTPNANDAAKEQDAVNDAIEDLAEALFTSLSGMW
jgi:hypothetical protein